MGRLRASLATSVVDRELFRHLADAGRALNRATELCHRAAQGQRRAVSDGMTRRRARDTLRTLLQMSKVLGEIGHLSTGMIEDPDLAPEKTAADRRPARLDAKTASGQPQKAGGN